MDMYNSSSKWRKRRKRTRSKGVGANECFQQHHRQKNAIIYSNIFMRNHHRHLSIISSSILVLSSLFLIFLLLDIPVVLMAAKEEQSVIKRAEQLSRALRSIFEDGTKHEEISRAYSNLADADVISPEAELKALKKELELYLKERVALAWNAKLSLEQKPFISMAIEENGAKNLSRLEPLNNYTKSTFVRYLNVKRMSDGTVIHSHGHQGGVIEVNATRPVILRSNPNFYGLPTSSDSSAVHVPTPIYERDPEILERIQWSDIDQLYRRNREQIKDLFFQKFCSESGFMRFFPIASWQWEDRQTELDLFDCRNTEWFVQTATVPRNLLILLDTSGSMLGQRFEIARQTIESLLGTLSDSDFFNIIQFSKTTTLLEECGGSHLVQATLRNKKLLLSRLSNITSEGKAEYEKALHQAFVTLMKLPEEGVKWRTKEEAAREIAARIDEGIEPEPDMRHIPLEDNVLIAPERFMQAIRKFTGNQQRMGCQDVIMLITDGAPGFYKEIFELYNKDKRVRMFSFVVGEEAKDFEQVRWMACSNRGFMAHIVSMADVQEKVQQYIRVLSRTVARQKAAFSQSTPVWSGITRERMSDQFVVSVSFPVVLPPLGGPFIGVSPVSHGQFMGVSSISVPLTELAQLAHSVRIGARSHFILMDSAGYVLLHPQLRPEELNGDLKVSFNSVEFVDVEVQRPNVARTVSIDCSAANGELGGGIEPKQMDVMFALDQLRRVYPQQNRYHAVCIQDTPYMLVLATPSDGGDLQRLERAKPLDLSGVQSEWMNGRDWRLHSGWRYCLLNDSDWMEGPEQAFREYARQMCNTGKMPEFCQSRRRLVDRALLDLQASSGFGQLWEKEWERNKKNGIHLAFFVGTSGVFRFRNQTLLPADRYFYEHSDQSTPNNSGIHSSAAYKHFLLEVNPKAAESDFFRRVARQPKERIIFDINRKTRLWQAKGRKTAFGHAENEALLAVAFKAVHVDDAFAGVAGIEFLYDTLAAQMRHIGCLLDGGGGSTSKGGGTNERTRCYLLDEHGLVVFSSNRDTSYEQFTHANIVLPEAAIAAAQNWSHAARKRKGMIQRGIWVQRLQQQQQQAQSQLELGRFFGQLNRVTEWTMELLIRRGFYRRVYFTDAQAICDPPSAETGGGQTMIASAANRLQSAFSSIGIMFLRLLFQIVSLLFTLLIPSELGSALQLNTFASLLKGNDGRFPCRMHSAYYLGQMEAKADGPDGALLESDSYERPCRQNAAQCAVRVFAAWVPHTNLLLITIKQDARSHCFHHDSASHCPISQPPAVPYGYSTSLPTTTTTSADFTQESSTLIERQQQQKQRNNNNMGGDNDEQQQQAEEQCLISRPQQQNQPVQCLRDDFLEDDAEGTCSAAAVPTMMSNAKWNGMLLALLLMMMMFLLLPYTSSL